jgi:hypothetical protein
MPRTIKIGTRKFTVLFPDLLRALTPGERKALKEDIEERHSVEVAVVVDEDDGIIDGIHRLAIAAEIGLTAVPCALRAGLTLDQKRDLAEALNIRRRHLTREEMREEIAKRLKEEPDASNRKIAEEVGADHQTVAASRENLEANGEIPRVEKTTGKDGKAQDRPQKKSKKSGGEFPHPGEVEISQIPTLEPRLDKNGKPWPERAFPALDCLEDFDALARQFSTLSAAVTAMSKRPIALHLNAAAIAESLQKHRKVISQARPYAVCPKCDGAGTVEGEQGISHCEWCRSGGWVTKDTYERHGGK